MSLSRRGLFGLLAGTALSPVLGVEPVVDRVSIEPRGVTGVSWASRSAKPVAEVTELWRGLYGRSYRANYIILAEDMIRDLALATDA